MSSARLAFAALGVLGAIAGGCGARTGLTDREDAPRLDAPRLDAPALDAPGLDAPVPPDVPADTGVDAPVPDGCRPVRVALTPITAEILLVLDRSTSMSWSLTGPTGAGPSRWSILGGALRAELPAWDGSSDLGLLFFPEPGGTNCTTASVPHLEPAPDGSGPLLSRLAATMPGGRTPTAAAMTTARDWFVAHRDPDRPQAVVLATDGAPNCNAALDARTCRCTNGAGLPAGGCPERELCLDDTRTLAVIADLLGAGVPTYVVGIDGEPDPALSIVLTRMAAAGGRPNPLDPARAYYSVRRPEDLGAALERIEASIARCVLVLERPAPEDRPLTVTLDGALVPADPSGTDGWRWTSDGSGRVELHGPTCDRAQDGASHVLELLVDC